MKNKYDQLELGQFIPPQYHYNMLNDTVRMQGFKNALELVVRPGARVLELGGGTGVLSFFAAKNAAHVWCVERNPYRTIASLGSRMKGAVYSPAAKNPTTAICVDRQ